MTQLSIGFSHTLANNSLTGLYQQPGVWVDAVYFTNSGGTANWTQLVANGTLQNDLSVTLPQSYSGGKVYLLVWSGAPTSTDPFQGSTGSNGFVTKESDIGIAKAETNDYRFDSVELTLNGSGAAAVNDVTNLTSVVGFGLPMQLNNNMGGTVGYNILGSTIFSDIQAIHPGNTSMVFPFTAGPLSTTTPAAVSRYGTAPASASQLTVPPFPTGTSAPFTENDWISYVNSFETPLNQPTLQLAGFFNGAPDANGIWHNQAFYNYSLSYDGTNFWLSPAANSQVKGYIQISPSQLENSIYATNANVSIYTNKTDATPYTIYDPNTSTQSSTMNVGANNQWGDVLKELFTGFTAGFWGATAPSSNSLVTPAVNLNQNWNWDPSYAFGGGGSSNKTNFDAYSQIFFANSNSYGSGYSDNLMALYRTGSPLLSVYNPATQADVATLNLTIYADSDPPGGYTKPTIYNYIAPGSGYVAPPSSSVGGSNSLSIGLNFSAPAGAAGQTTWLLDQTKAQVTLNVLTGITGGVASWTPITLKATQAEGSSTPTLWWNWQVSSNGQGGYTATPIDKSLQDPGSLVITGMPINTSSTADAVTWYQIEVENTDGSASKTFNLYTTTQLDPNVMPGNPVVTGSQSTISNGTLTIGGAISHPQGGTPPFAPGMTISGVGIPSGVTITGNGTGTGGAGTYTISNNSISVSTPEAISGLSGSTKVSGTGYGFVPTALAEQIDGGANVAFSATQTPFVTDPTISVNFQNGVFTSVDPSLLVMGPQPGGNTIPMEGTPSAPVAGTVSGGTFTILPGTTASSPTSISASTSNSSVSFGWTGLFPGAPVNPTYNTNGSYNPGWITSYTNKLSPLDYGLILVTNTATSTVVSGTLTQADIDGNWVSAWPVTLGDGNYTVTVQEFGFVPVDVPGIGSIPFPMLVGNKSSPLSLTIDAADLTLSKVDAINPGLAVGTVNLLAATADTAGTVGNWIRLDPSATASTLPQGATVLLYATRSDGTLIARDGHTGPDVTLDSATLAKIGLMKSDAGVDLISAGQSVFVHAEDQLHFAVVNKDGSINAAPSVNIVALGSGGYDVNVGGLHLTAAINNTLSDSANLAQVQHNTDLPLMFLNKGATFNVEVAGSAANTNTVGFVNFDFDITTGKYSVAGVQYGATLAFWNAVRANLDAGFKTTAGSSTFDIETTWTVAGKTGYYAPVMVSQNGDIFVVGSANSDGREHIRLMGENSFGIEDLTVSQRSDFDYNDILVSLHLQPAKLVGVNIESGQVPGGV